MQNVAQRILYEDNHILAINKLSGEIVQGDKTGNEPLSELLKRFIKERDAKPGNVFMGVTHRLDRPVSGAMLFAKTSKALSRLNEVFRTNDVRKTYWAIVKNRPPKDEDILTHYLTRDEKQNKSAAYSKPVPNSKEAKLIYRLIASSDTYYMLEIQLLTGRHHQIRSQLAAIGCPIKGDLKYGFPRSNPNGGISLHARTIELIHPVKKEPLKIVAAVPDNKLWKWFEKRTNT
ncbi:MAG: RluA family pseudouridine synthase [Prevotellaceae bacterium]|jgi:23S rRNA pseudouridine1911/1915/1917 synthase|nr:RluA family pseudouridine synthase [Prevotellaceae bacterium]